MLTMNIQEIKNQFPDVDIKDGDMGIYAEIRVQVSLYIHVYESDFYPPDLYKDARLATPLQGVKSIEDIKSFIKLIKGNGTE